MKTKGELLLELEELKKSEREKSAILDSLLEAVTYLDTEMRVLWASKAARESVGLAPGQIVGRHCYRIWCRRGEPHVECPALKTMKSAQPAQGEISTPDGKVWLHRSYPTLDEGGKVVSIVMIALDITGRKQSEEALLKSENAYRTLSENLPGMVYRVFLRENNRMQFFNRLVHAMTGYGVEELYAGEVCSIEPFIIEQDRGRIMTAVKQAIRERRPFEVTYRFRRKDGEIRFFSERGRPIYGEDGEPLYIDGVIFDITDRKRVELERKSLLVKLEDERRKAEQTAVEAQERASQLDAVFQAMPQPVIVFDTEGTPVKSNAVAVNYGFVPLRAGAPQRLSEKFPLRHPDGRPVAEKELSSRRALRGEKVAGIHFICPYPDGKEIHLLASSAPFYREGNISGVVTVLNDVTEREELLGKVRRSRDELEIQVRERTRELVKVNEKLKREIEEREQTQQKLTEQAKILEAFFSSTITPLVFLDKDFNFVRVNKAYAKCCQRDILEFQGQNHFEFYPQEENEAIFRKVVETKVPFQAFAKPFSFPDHPDWGVTYWDWALTPLLNSEGEVEFLVFALNDVSERKRAEEKHRLLATAVEQAAEGVLIMDRHFVLRYANPALLKISGCSPEDIVGRNAAVTRNDQRPAPFYKSLRDTIRRGEIWEGLYPVKRRDGTICQLNVNIAPARNESGAVTHYVVHCHDITQELELEERLRQAQKMEALGTLAGGIAHDFNNLLSPIILNVELALWDIQEGTLPSPDNLKMVVEAAKRGQRLVKQILIFSRQKEQQKEPVEITSTLKEAMKFLRSTIPKSIEMREAFEAGPATVLADSTQMYQVLMNLCSNAAHAMREKGGILEVTLTRIEIDRDMAVQHVDLKPGSYLRLTVRDTGQGMDREVKEKAFDPFFTTKKPGEGTGIGLAVVHGIVKNHEGAITLESEVGKGTMVSVFLPLIQVKQEAGISSSGPLLGGDERVLLVDDEEMQVRSVQGMLERLGYRVTGKTDPREALGLFRAGPEAFDLAIVDQTMPHMAGNKLALELLRLRPDLPIILCTGFSEVINGEEAIALGIRDLAMKPLTAGDLAERIRRVLKGTG